jgi:hypothetical protein
LSLPATCEGPAAPAWFKRDLPRVAREDFVAVAALLAVVAAVLGRPLFLGEVFFDRDVAAVFHPMAESFYRTFQAGSLPLWNPWLSLGEPMLANPSAQVLYPPTWLMLAIPPGTYYTLYVFAHLGLGAAGLYALGRDLGLSRASACTGGAVWIVTGPVLSLVNVWHHLGGACWMPWVIRAGHRALSRRRRRDAATWGLVLAIQVFAGSPDLCLLTIIASVACLAPELLGASRETLRSTMPVLGIAGLVAITTAAGQWLPTLDVARRGARLALSEETRGFWSLHPWLLPQILAPLTWRALPEFSPRTGELFEAWEPFLHSVYLGAPALALVAAAFVLPDAPWRRRLLLLGGLGLVFALGTHTPLYRLATMAIPPLAIIRYPAKVAVLTSFAWSLLAAQGAEAWRRRPEIPRARWVSRVTAPCLFVSVALGVAAVTLWNAPLDVVRRLLVAADPAAAAGAIFAPAAQALAAAAALLATAALLSLARAERAFVLAAALAVLDLAWAHRGLNPTVSPDFYRYRPQILRSQTVRPGMRVYAWDYAPTAAGPSRHGLAGAFMDVQSGFPPTVSRALGLQTYLYAPTSARWGVYGSFDRDLLGLTSREVLDMRTAIAATEETPAAPILARLGAVDVVVALHTLAPPFEPAGIFHDAPLRLPARAFRVPDPLPRLYAVTEAVARRGNEDLGPLVTGELDPRSVVVLDTAAAPPPGRGAVARLAAVEERPDRLGATVDSDAAGWLVWVNAHDPGWHARIDGTDAPVLRANHAFMAVAFPPGRHVVEVRYRPVAASAGLAVTLTGLAAALVLSAGRS